MLQQRGGGRPSVSDEHIEDIREAFQRSPRKSIRRASLELNIPKTTLHRVVRKRLHLYAYKLQLVQALQPNDKPRRLAFAVDLLDRIEEKNEFLARILFTDDATFHTCGKVNRHNARIWGSQHPYAIIEHVRDSPKVNVWCGIMCDRIIGPFFFAERTVNGVIYLDMLEQFVIPQLELQPQVIFQQDGAPPHWSLMVRRFLDQTFPDRWMGRDGPMLWPPRSPDLTPLDFFLWGYVKDIVYRTPVPNIDELIMRITAAVANIDIDMLQRTWREIEYRLDILRATRGAHVEIY